MNRLWPEILFLAALRVWVGFSQGPDIAGVTWDIDGSQRKEGLWRTWRIKHQVLDLEPFRLLTLITEFKASRVKVGDFQELGVTKSNGQTSSRHSVKSVHKRTETEVRADTLVRERGEWVRAYRLTDPWGAMYLAFPHTLWLLEAGNKSSRLI